jgi:hypothetical protein
MNYIREINAFYDWLETNELSVSAISLWYALMHINNKTGWKNEFTVALSVLSIKSGLSPRAVTNARKELTEKGRIKWKSRNGNQAAEYCVNSLAGELQELYADKVADNATDKVACKATDNYTDITTTLTKRKPKQNINDIYTPEFETFWQHYPRHEAKQTALKCWNTRITQGESPDDMIAGAKNYATKCQAEEKEAKFIKLPTTFIGPDKHYMDCLQSEPKADLMALLGFEGCELVT